MRDAAMRRCGDAGRRESEEAGEAGETVTVLTHVCMRSVAITVCYKVFSSSQCVRAEWIDLGYCGSAGVSELFV
jgi:hypothetical protein